MKDDSSARKGSTFLSVPVVAIGRVAASVFVPVVAFVVLWAGFIFLRDSEASRGVIGIVAVVWGVGGVIGLFVIANWLVEKLPVLWRTRIQPFVFVGPALVILGWYLFLPTVRTLYLSFFDARGQEFVGLANYIYAFTNSAMIESFVNNLQWIVIGTGGSVGFGLLIALLADRSRYERIFKAIIFMPMAISFVGAGVIWRFVYAFRPAGEAQIGILNAVTTAFGASPQAWLTIRPWNTFFLIVILIWLQTGYAMVLISSAIKGVPSQLIEAGRIDGASEFRVIRSIVIPHIMSTIVTVATTILILSLKIFDIVFTMTNGLYGTEVMASLQYKQMFRFFHYGRGSSIAIVLLIAVIPVMWYNLKRFTEREAF